jgi:hypothetical protein
VIDLLSIFVATFLGAGAAFLSDRLLKRRDSLLAEEAAINNLLIDLAAKRAFAPDSNVRWARGAGGRILDSANHARGLVRTTRMALRPRSKFLEPLMNMVLACNTFIEQAEYRKGGMPTGEDLATFTAEMQREARNIVEIRPHRVVGYAPGSLALSQRVDRSRRG